MNKHCKTCEWWGNGNSMQFELDGLIYKWCGNPKMTCGFPRKNDYCKVSCPREDFGCLMHINKNKGKIKIKIKEK